MFEFQAIMTKLAGSRKIFHNEADLKHALAWQIQKHNPDISVRFEKKIRYFDKKRFIDIWLVEKSSGRAVAIELKYKKAPIIVSVEGEDFVLTSDSGDDQAAYDFLFDIERLELLIKENQQIEAYALILTNYSNYWTDSGRKSVKDNFRLLEGRVMTGHLPWSENPGAGTLGGRNVDGINLSGSYRLSWSEFFDFGIKNGRFRYLAVKVQ